MAELMGFDTTVKAELLEWKNPVWKNTILFQTEIAKNLKYFLY